MNLANNLKDFLEDKKAEKITSKEIANMLNISKTTLSNYANGDCYIPLIHLNKLCNYFNISMDYLFGLTKKSKYLKMKNIEDLNALEIGKNLKEFRKSKKISQQEIANLIGVNKSSISRYENGKSLILTVCLYTICTKYKVSADYLLGRINKPVKF